MATSATREGFARIQLPVSNYHEHLHIDSIELPLQKDKSFFFLVKLLKNTHGIFFFHLNLSSLN
jgi:hypothetical protein